MDLEEAIKDRRAVRDFTPETVDETTIRRLIDAAVQAPSAMNQQPWTFAVIRDRGIMDRISVEAKIHMLATMPAGPQADHFRPSLSSPDFHIFHQAPLLIVISAAAHVPWMVEDCALAAQNLMLAAHAADLGTCWIGLAQGYLNTTAGRNILGCPESWVPIAPIIAGYPKSWPQPVPRKPPEIRWVG